MVVSRFGLNWGQPVMVHFPCLFSSTLVSRFSLIWHWLVMVVSRFGSIWGRPMMVHLPLLFCSPLIWWLLACFSWFLFLLIWRCCLGGWWWANLRSIWWLGGRWWADLRPISLDLYLCFSSSSLGGHVVHLRLPTNFLAAFCGGL